MTLPIITKEVFYMQCSYGSIWRKWDFHVHTPYSILNNNYGFNPFELAENDLETEFDEYVKNLFTLAVENNVAAIGITDYFMLEGYKRIKEKYLSSPSKMLQCFPDDELRRKIKKIFIFPNIELRLENFVGRNANSVNYHVIFSNDLTIEDFEEFFKNGNHRQKVEKFFQSFGNGTGMSSNSVQITEENGKTKIKIDSQNSDMTYIIDGQQAPKDNVQIPDKILNVNIIPSKEDVKKSYLFITSRDRLGEFVSFQNGVLTFKYNSQEYKYNLEKMKEPLLVIDGRLADRFDIDPSEILQIRPISPIEKEVGYYPNAEVIINTK